MKDAPQPRGIFHRMIEYRRLILRAIFSVIIFGCLIYIINLLFFEKVNNEFRDILNVIIGALLASFSKMTDFWFKKDDDDDETKTP